MIKLLKNIAITARLTVSSISAICCLTYLINAKGFSIENIILCTAMIFVTGAGFIFNDIFDYQKDKAGLKNRPICKDLISKRQGIIAGVIFSISGILIPLLFKSFSGAMVILSTTIAVILYSPFSKKYSLFKGLYTSLLCCTPILYANVISGKYITSYAYIAIILFIIGREILLDIFDFSGDAISKRKTLPVILGKQISNQLSCFFMLAGVITLLFLTKNNYIFLSFSIISFLLTLISLVLPLRFELAKINITRLVMLIACLSLALL
jgi:4-hydroxybenzoate polyprenyltransferase